MFDTNSIYYEPEINSTISTNNYLNLKLDINDFFVVKFNQLLHFNKINKTGKLRGGHRNNPRRWKNNCSSSRRKIYSKKA